MDYMDRIEERDIVEVVHDTAGARAGTQGVVLLDWTDGRYEVATRESFVPLTVAGDDLNVLARPAPRRIRGR